MSTQRNLSGTQWEELPAFDRLRGTEVREEGGEKIGTVDGVYVQGDRDVRYLAVKTGRLGGKRHVVPLDDVGYSSDQDAIVVPYARDRISKAPAFDQDAELSDADEEHIYSHYGRRGYWEEVRAKQTTPSATPQIAEADVAAAHARGEDALRGDIGAPGDDLDRDRRMDRDRDRDPDLGDDRAPADRDRLGRPGTRGVRRYDW